MLTIQNIIDRIGQSRVNNFALDYSGQKTTDEVVLMCLNSARLFVKSLCYKFNQTFNEDDEIQAESITFFAIGEIYDYANDNDLNGTDEKTQARELLYNVWDIKEVTNETPLKPFISVTNSKGRQRIENIDLFLD